MSRRASEDDDGGASRAATATAIVSPLVIDARGAAAAAATTTTTTTTKTTTTTQHPPSSGSATNRRRASNTSTPSRRSIDHGGSASSLTKIEGLEHMCNPLALRDAMTRVEDGREEMSPSRRWRRAQRDDEKDHDDEDDDERDAGDDCGGRHDETIGRVRDSDAVHARASSMMMMTKTSTSAPELPNTPDVETFDDDYTRVSRIGSGRYGTAVWLAISASDSSKKVAMKTVSLSTLRDDKEMATLLENEIELHRACGASRFIVTLHSVSCEAHFVNLVQELGEGGDLFAHLMAMPDSKCDEHRAAYYAASVLMAVKFCHEMGVVFRDVKLENCILFSDGSLKLTDFGLAKRLRGLPNERSSSTRGTCAYMAPELIIGPYHSYAVDFWALGVLTHVLLTGTFPFTGTNDKDVYESVLAGYDATRSKMAHVTSCTSQEFVASLLNRDEARRADFSGARAHAFFATIDFHALLCGVTMGHPRVNIPTRSI